MNNYYKIVVGNSVVDVNNVFLRWQPRNQTLLLSTSEKGQYVQTSDCSKYLTADWLVKAPEGAPKCDTVQVILIDKDEYDELRKALDEGKEVEVTPDHVEETVEEVIEEPVETTPTVMSVTEMRYMLSKLTGAEDESIMSLDELKAYKIKKSKENLAKFLEENPLVSSCHGGKTAKYSATLEKQNLFASKYMAHAAKVSAGIPDVMTWNATGEPCEQWTEQECIAFISEMDAYVTPLVAKQQYMEIQINSAVTTDAVKMIDITF